MPRRVERTDRALLPGHARPVFPVSHLLAVDQRDRGARQANAWYWPSDHRHNRTDMARDLAEGGHSASQIADRISFHYRPRLRSSDGEGLRGGECVAERIQTRAAELPWQALPPACRND